jgi:hypothetical protein
MTANHAFAGVAAMEEMLAVACAVVAEWVPDCETPLGELAEAHRRAAVELMVRPRRWLKLRMTVAAMLGGGVGTKLGALGWLRTQEQRLVDDYVALEGSPALDLGDRHRLRRALLPAAFERFSRVDQLIMTCEEEGAYA